MRAISRRSSLPATASRFRRSSSPRAGGQWLDEVAACGASAVGRLDGRHRPRARARRRARGHPGNLDPPCCSRTLTPSRAKPRRWSVLPGPHPANIFNLGHGIVPATPPENVAALVAAVHRESAATRASLDLRAVSLGKRRKPASALAPRALANSASDAAPRSYAHSFVKSPAPARVVRARWGRCAAHEDKA